MRARTGNASARRGEASGFTFRPLAAGGPEVPATVSFSVDGDALRAYGNFAPEGQRAGREFFTYGEMLPTVLEILDALRIRATFFCVAQDLESTDALDFYRTALQRGHRIGNHSFSHAFPPALSPDEVRGEVRKAHDIIGDRLGLSPSGYRAPAYGLTLDTIDELMRLEYSYDSSAYRSRLSEMGIRFWSLFRRHFRPTAHSPLSRCFSADRPTRIINDDGQRLLEWPIPVAWGAAFYGTVHTILPRPVFRIQARRLLSRLRHVHYEIHPIEVLSDACAMEFPWLPTARPAAARSGKERAAWLRERLKVLCDGRAATTLEEMSVLPVYSDDR
jgi:peptidoglycan/xylan/chitin deacetylase (PgdA/CDA1 family)